MCNLWSRLPFWSISGIYVIWNASECGGGSPVARALQLTLMEANGFEVRIPKGTASQGRNKWSDNTVLYHFICWRLSKKGLSLRNPDFIQVPANWPCKLVFVPEVSIIFPCFVSSIAVSASDILDCADVFILCTASCFSNGMQVPGGHELLLMFSLLYLQGLVQCLAQSKSS